MCRKKREEEEQEERHGGLNSSDSGDVEIERQDEVRWDKRSGSKAANCGCSPAFGADVERASDMATVKAEAEMAVFLV